MTPASTIDPLLLLKANNVKVAFFDIDGVMTDGGLLISEAGETLKQFNTLDGLGLKLLLQANIVPVVITGRDSQPLRVRLQTLGIVNAFFGKDEKLPWAEEYIRVAGLDWANAAAIGDDWPDLPVMQRAAFSCAPANAHPEVRARADHVTAASGGKGAAREFCDLLLLANGCYMDMLKIYCR